MSTDKTTMRVLVCGGRHYRDWGAVSRALKRLHADTPISVLIHGGAPGADALADTWARLNGVPAQCFEAKWKEHGRAAGPIRNQQMLSDGHPDLVVAFPGGTGTADMCLRATDAGVEIWKPLEEQYA